MLVTTVMFMMGVRADNGEKGLQDASAPHSSACELAVIILSYRNEDTILAAVDSVLAQDPPVELIVSHSGGGATPEIVERERPEVRVVATEHRRLPGGARNAGIRATSAPYVAFLAGDCRADPGWAAERLRHHRGGAAAVGSSIAPTERSLASIASHLLRHSWRMAHLSDPRRVGKTGAWPSGVSYPRTAFELFGLFDEDMLCDEDSEFNHRLWRAGLSFSWAPEVLTRHAYPTTFGELLSDSYRRGRLHGSAARPGSDRLALALRAPLVAARAAERARLPGSPIGGTELLSALPATVAAGLARSAGVVRAGDPAGSASRAFQAVRRREVLAARRDPGPLAGVVAHNLRRARWLVGFTFRLVRRALIRRLGLRRLRTVWSGGRASTGTPSVRLIALLAARNEMWYLPGYLANIAPHVDGIVALDDGSTDGTAECLAAHPKVLEVLRVPPDRPVWDEVGNHRALVHAGLRHGAEWFIVLDADERVEHDFRARAERVIRRGTRRGMSAFALRLRDVWDSPERFRADGVWGGKCVARLFRALPDHEFDDRVVHATKAPLQSRRGASYPIADVVIYHLRMLCPEDRLVRRQRYETIDPEARYQPSHGYAYLTDETGLRLRRIPRRRTWSESVADAADQRSRDRTLAESRPAR